MPELSPIARLIWPSSPALQAQPTPAAIPITKALPETLPEETVFPPPVADLYQGQSSESPSAISALPDKASLLSVLLRAEPDLEIAKTLQAAAQRLILGMKSQISPADLFRVQRLEPESEKPSTENLEVYNQVFNHPKTPLSTLALVVLQSPTLAEEIRGQENGEAALSALEKAAKHHPLSKSEIKALQGFLSKTLKRDIGYFKDETGIDGSFGHRTRLALQGYLRHKISPTALNALSLDLDFVKQTQPSKGPSIAYDRLLADNLLDMTLAVGYEPGQDMATSQGDKLVKGLITRGFTQDKARALELLKAAGQNPQEDYEYLVKENIGIKDGQPVHAVVRLIRPTLENQETVGASHRSATLEGMDQSDVFMYAGHARYGSGLDFDAKFKVTINWEGMPGAPATGKVVYEDLEALKKVLGKNNQAVLKKVAELEQAGRLSIEGKSEGNILINPENQHPQELGAVLMYKSLQGQDSPLPQALTQDHYRLWLLNGCRSEDYLPALRAMGESQSQLAPENLELVLTTEKLYFQDTVDSMFALLDGIQAQESNKTLLKNLEKENLDAAQKSHFIDGTNQTRL